MRDRHSLTYIVRDEDVIFSLAGQVSHLDSMQDPMTDLEINCAAQLSLLECCREHNPAARIVFASTRQLYGRPKALPDSTVGVQWNQPKHESGSVLCVHVWSQAARPIGSPPVPSVKIRDTREPDNSPSPSLAAGEESAANDAAPKYA